MFQGSPFHSSALTTRSPAKEKYSCADCDKEDNDDMVQCDKCNSWHHFVCVNVTNDIANHSWECRKCEELSLSQNKLSSGVQLPQENIETVSGPTADITRNNKLHCENRTSKSKSQASRRSQRKKELAIKKLEEEHLLQQQYIHKKYEILNNNSSSEDEENYDDAAESVLSIKKVDDWLQRNPSLNIPIVNMAPSSIVDSNRNLQPNIHEKDSALQLRTKQISSCSKTQYSGNQHQHFSPPEVEVEFDPKNSKLNTFAHTSQLQSISENKLCNDNRKPYNGTKPKIFQSSNLPLAFTPQGAMHNIPNFRFDIPADFMYEPPSLDKNNLWTATTKSQPTKLKGKSSQRNQLAEPRVHRPPNSHTINANSADIVPNLVTALNAQHLAARHAMPKALPSFSGRCEEWPLFVSAFETTTRTCNFTNDENLVRLQTALKGKALEAVRSRLLLPSNVPGIIATLRMLFGKPELIINTLLHKIRKEPPPRAEKLETIINFALSVQNLCATMEASNLTAHLWNPSLIQELTEKLPAQIKLSWALHKQTLQNVTLASLSSWLTEVATAASDVTVFTDFNQYSEAAEWKSERRAPKNKVSFLNTHLETASEKSYSSNESYNTTRVTNAEKLCLICKLACTSVKHCDKFLSMDHNQRWSTVRAHKLCRKCLYAHGRIPCKSKDVCGKNNCQYKHHKLLHNDKNYDETRKSDTSEIVATQLHCNSHQTTKSSVLFRIIPVIVSSRTVTIKTFAFLDDGSSITLIEKDLANELELSGTPDPICLKWTGDIHRSETHSQRVSFQISGNDNKSRSYKIEGAHTIDSLDLPTQTISANDLSDKYHHLKGFPIDSYEKGTPRLLIGLDNLNLQLPLKVKEGNVAEPVASKTRIGWTVYGPCKYNESGSAYVRDEYHSFHICECNADNDLNRIVKEYFALESMGTTKQEQIVESADDKRARAILESSTARIGNHYEVGLLWKYDDIYLPNSLPMAKRRFDSLEKRLAKDPDLATILEKQIQDYTSKGYARKLTQSELQYHHDRVWYLPIFPVTNPNKPGKVRMVWDAAAKTNGTSLNDVLLKGPDQLSSLLAVLLRFRERKVAICADISEMFHQIGIKKEDQHAQRFLWRDRGENGDPDTYVMQVMTFGATCSPSCAQYIMKKNAAEFTNNFPRAVTSINTNHYVDDLLDCTDTADQAIQLAKEIFEIHSHAGFHIRNFISNSAAVLRALGENNLASKKKLNISNELEADKVLGMWWNTKTDNFTFSLAFNKSNQEYLSGSRRPTKREVLRTLMTIFDPLGLLAFYLVYLKVLLQDVWRSSIEWDDALTDAQNEKWQQWIQLLPNVKTVQIPRCYLRETPFYTNTQLHIFADASEDAYAAVVYLRTVSNNGVQCSIVGAKSKVAPIKPISIPRLELEAATLAARLAKTIGTAITIPIDRRYFWIDSNVVKCWLNSDQKKYRQFVAFRIGEILEISDVEEWNWLPSKMNVADEATKWQKTPDFSPRSRWFNGPSFLYQPENVWKPNQSENDDTTEELKPQYIFHVKNVATNLIDVSRHSNWRRLLRLMGYWYRYILNLKAKTKAHPIRTGPLRQDEMKRAENFLYRQSQLESYPDEISILVQNNDSNMKLVLDKSSALFKHCPQLDENGVIRAWGRIDAAVGITTETKRPILLASDHLVTRLIINDFHRRYHHHNHETVINELRQLYSIPRLRATLKNIRSTCQLCKNSAVSPQIPRMAELPVCRLSTFTRPFSYIGIDYFGPMTVSIGRRTEKRWGMLVTCLTVRAIHIEVAHSLSTDSCILCLRNFMARRGTPIEIYCDNGTNFRGADRELQSAVQQISKEKLIEEFETSTTKWIFNPPAAPHMGGSWERLVRSVKTTLHQIKPARNPTDELLHSMLLEVENIVNSRPLTYIPIDNANDESLTPNHFLLGSSNGSKPIGVFDDDKVLMKKNYMKSQQYACQFWRRWIKEYLPSLTRRTKWFKPVKPLTQGDVVIIVDENSPRSCWPKGRIIKTFIAKDGQVRRVIVKTTSGVYERPASKIAVLDVGKEQSKSLNNNDLPAGSVAGASCTTSNNASLIGAETSKATATSATKASSSGRCDYEKRIV